MNNDFTIATITETIKEKYSIEIANVFKNYIIDEAVDIENLEIDLEDLNDSFLISHMVNKFHWKHDEVNRFCLLIRKCLDPNIAELTRMPTCLAKANMPSEYLVRGYLRRIEEEWRIKCLDAYIHTNSPTPEDNEYINDYFNADDKKNLKSIMHETNNNNNNNCSAVHNTNKSTTIEAMEIQELNPVISKDSSNIETIKEDIKPIEVGNEDLRRHNSNILNLSQSETKIVETPLIFKQNTNQTTVVEYESKEHTNVSTSKKISMVEFENRENKSTNKKPAVALMGNEECCSPPPALPIYSSDQQLLSNNFNHRLRHSCSTSSFEHTRDKTGDSFSPLLIGFEGPLYITRSYSMMTIPEEITRLCVKYLQEICVYAVGRNDRGEFGIPGRRNFTKLTELEWITKEANFSLFTIIPCTLNGIAYISEDRNLYVCGFNKWAQFGLGHCEHAVEVPTLHTFYKKYSMKISYVSHGQRAYHMFVMTHDGSIYAHGANEWGQLGLNRQKNKEMFPVLMPVETWIAQPKTTTIKQITCGIEHSIFLTNTGDVYSCGRNKWGQLGFGPPITEILVPTIIPTILEYHIETIECGDSNTYVIDEHKHIWSWGRNEFGELGCNDQDIASRWEPRKIMFFIDNNIPINKLVVGSDHVLVLDEYGKVYSWGFGRFGCCGDGTRKHHYKPIEITALSRFRITDVSCGSTHSIAITDDREIFSWGYNLMNQCCIDTFNETRIITCREIRSPRMVTTAINKLFSPQPNVLGIRTATNSTLFIIENFAFQNYTKGNGEGGDDGDGDGDILGNGSSNNNNNNSNNNNSSGSGSGGVNGSGSGGVNGSGSGSGNIGSGNLSTQLNNNNINVDSNLVFDECDNNMIDNQNIDSMIDSIYDGIDN